jgi:hypothetical protein
MILRNARFQAADSTFVEPGLLPAPQGEPSYFEMIAVPAMSGSSTTGTPLACENSSTALRTPR